MIQNLEQRRAAALGEIVENSKACSQNPTCNLNVGEINSILAAQLGLLPLLNDFIRSRQHVRRNREADLLGGFEIDHELELYRLLHRKISRLGSFEDLIHVRSGAAVCVS